MRMKGRVSDKKRERTPGRYCTRQYNEVLSKCVVFLKKRVKRKISFNRNDGGIGK